MHALGRRTIIRNMMFRSMQFRFAVIALFAVAAIPLTTASARAFSQENSGAGEGGNSTFADPDEQVNHFGQGVRPFGSNGLVVQFGGQQGQLTPFGRFQGNGFNSPPARIALSAHSSTIQGGGKRRADGMEGR
jgi:hypothetical protein